MVKCLGRTARPLSMGGETTLISCDLIPNIADAMAGIFSANLRPWKSRNLSFRNFSILWALAHFYPSLNCLWEPILLQSALDSGDSDVFSGYTLRLEGFGRKSGCTMRPSPWRIRYLVAWTKCDHCTDDVSSPLVYCHAFTFVRLTF
jgi:hypothetical protein